MGNIVSVGDIGNESLFFFSCTLNMLKTSWCLFVNQIFESVSDLFAKEISKRI